MTNKNEVQFSLVKLVSSLTSDLEPPMVEPFTNKRKNIKPGLWFKNLEPQIAEQFAKENVKKKDCGSRILNRKSLRDLPIKENVKNF